MECTIHSCYDTGMYHLNQRVHSTWFVTVGCIGLLIGIALARYVGQISFMFFIAGGVAILFSLLHRHAWMFVFVALGAVIIGLWRGGLEMQALSVYGLAIGKVATVSAKVSADPQIVNGSKQAVALTNISTQHTALSGTIYVTLGDNPKLRREDKITVSGKLAPGYGNYAASMYDAKLQNVERPNDIFLNARDAFSEALRKVIAEPMASLGGWFFGWPKKRAAK